jgi:spore coat protein U-like protein
VSATVSANCTISAANLNFGTYDPVVANATANLDVTGSITVACTKGTSASIGLNQGLFPGASSTATVPIRNMGFGTNRLRYDLYRTSPGVGHWGDIATANVANYTSVTKSPTTLNVYGRIPMNQDVSSGTYNDTVTATISF